MSLWMHTKWYVDRLAGPTIRGLARGGVLLAASVGVLLLDVTSLGLASDQRDQEHSTQYSEQSPRTGDVDPTMPAECARRPGRHLVALFFDRPGIEGLVPTTAQDDDAEPCDECCAIAACHAAAGNIGSATWTRNPASSVVALTESPALFGRGQAPPERPPRVA